MASIQHVEKARATKDGDRPDCYTCHQPIEIGQAYDWFKANRFSYRFNWHATCAAPRPSALESNEKRSTAMAAFEDAYDAAGALDPQEYLGAGNEPQEPAQRLSEAATALLADLGSIAEQCAEGVREAAEMWRESASNIESGFGTATYQSDEMNEHGDTYDSVADEVEQIVSALDEWEPEAWGADDEGFTEWAQSAVEAFTEDLGSAEGSLD